MKRPLSDPAGAPPAQRLRGETSSTPVGQSAVPGSSSGSEAGASTGPCSPAPQALAGVVPPRRTPILSLLDNPALAVTFITKLCCPKDRQRINACDWPGMKMDSAMDLVRDAVRRQGFVDRVENTFAELDVTRDQRDRAIAECTVMMTELREARAAYQEVEKTASELKVKEGDLIQERNEALAELRETVKAKEIAEADRVALERLQKETEAFAARAGAERDAARVSLEDRAKQLERSEADAARRERALRQKMEELKRYHAAELARSRQLQSPQGVEELRSAKAAFEEKTKQLERAEAEAAARERRLLNEMEELKKAHVMEIDRIRRLRFEELAAEPGCHETLVEQMVDVFKNGFNKCKEVVMEKYPQVELNDLRPEEL